MLKARMKSLEFTLQKWFLLTFYDIEEKLSVFLPQGDILHCSAFIFWIQSK